MTAIAGFWNQGGPLAPPEHCRKMLAAQAIYGPHGCSAAQLDDFALGRCLFRTLPEDAYDRQPVIGGNGRFALSADIRLDNRLELAAALGLTAADAAVLADSSLLLLSLERWGDTALDRIVGDYAFAFFDRHEQRLVLARDPLGQRPLFWHRGPHFVAFASMPSGLRALGSVPRRPNTNSLARFVARLPIDGDASYHEGIQRVEPGHVLAISLKGITSRRYWNLVRRELRLKSFEDYVEAYRFHLDQSVASRLRRLDRPVAAHLSGGWDSAAVTATAARLLSRESEGVIAFTSVPQAGAAAAAPAHEFANEGPLAAATAERFPNVHHILVESPQRSPVEDLERYSRLFQRPSFNLLNHVWLSEIRTQARARGAGVLLTGEIGNWTISAAPNSILADFIRERRWSAWQREARAMLLDRRARVRGVAANSFGPWVPDLAWRCFRGLSSAPAPGSQGALHPSWKARLASACEESELGSESRPKNNFERSVLAFSRMDFGEYRKGILGGWGIDKRDATADRRLIEFCLSLPITMLADQGVRRPLARAALSDRLPDAVLNEKRKGLQSADWQEGMARSLPAISSLIEEMATNDAAASVLDIDALRRWVEEWPDDGWNRPAMLSRYRAALPQALTAGSFAISATG
jgi:asparagine synthase (glutamine-hydrolysing)